MKTLFFDLDGTLINSEPGITKCVQYALDAFGIEENDMDRLRRFIGPPLFDSFCKYYDFDEKIQKVIAGGTGLNYTFVLDGKTEKIRLK